MLSPYTARFSNKHRPKVSAGKRRKILTRDTRCARCGTTEQLTVDHRLPACRGGTNALENLQALCLRCNQRKAKGELHRVPSVVIDFERCGSRDGLIEALARTPPQAQPGDVFLLYGRGNRSVPATYEGYVRTGRLPCIVFFRMAATGAAETRNETDTL